MADKKESTEISSRKSNWSQLPIDLCDLIFSKMTPKNILRFKAVCTSWCKAVQYARSSPSFTCLPEPPWLFINQKDENGISLDGARFQFYSLEENKVYKLREMADEFAEGICIGSSHGWLLFLTNQYEFLLLNPLSWTRILLPPSNTFPYDVYDDRCGKYYDFLRLGKMMRKAVVSWRARNCSNKNSIGVLVCTDHSSLAFCTAADDKWTKLGDEGRWYIDIMSYDNHFYALREDCSVQVWDFQNSFPIKYMEIEASNPHCEYYYDGCKHKSYMIKTAEDVLLVVILYKIGILVAHKLEHYSDDGRWRWVEVESIGNRALLLGSNQSIVIAPHDALQCDRDSIYFTNQIFKDPEDQFGVFDFKDNSFREVKIGDHPAWLDVVPPAYWFDPSPL